MEAYEDEDIYSSVTNASGVAGQKKVLEQLAAANGNLKLRIFFLEAQVRRAGGDPSAGAAAIEDIRKAMDIESARSRAAAREAEQMAQMYKEQVAELLRELQELRGCVQEETDTNQNGIRQQGGQHYPFGLTKLLNHGQGKESRELQYSTVSSSRHSLQPDTSSAGVESHLQDALREIDKIRYSENQLRRALSDLEAKHETLQAQHSALQCQIFEQISEANDSPTLIGNEPASRNRNASQEREITTLRAGTEKPAQAAEKMSKEVASQTTLAVHGIPNRVGENSGKGNSSRISKEVLKEMNACLSALKLVQSELCSTKLHRRALQETLTRL